MPTQKQLLGQQAETAARKYLERRGLQFETCNYHCHFGELDLIMRDGEYLVFVEVRYRKPSGYGDGIDSITNSKKHKLISSAKCYLLERKLFDKIPCRFDVVAAAPNKERSLTWIKDAFWVG